MELAATYAPHTHEAVHVNNTHDERLAREERGQCPSCGNQTHKIGKACFCCGETRTALTIPGLVSNGICLKCHPDHAAPVPAGALADAMSAGGAGGGAAAAAAPRMQPQPPAVPAVAAPSLAGLSAEDRAVVEAALAEIKGGEEWIQ